MKTTGCQQPPTLCNRAMSAWNWLLWAHPQKNRSTQKERGKTTNDRRQNVRPQIAVKRKASEWFCHYFLLSFLFFWSSVRSALSHALHHWIITKWVNQYGNKKIKTKRRKKKRWLVACVTLTRIKNFSDVKSKDFELNRRLPKKNDFHSIREIVRSDKNEF